MTLDTPQPARRHFFGRFGSAIGIGLAALGSRSVPAEAAGKTPKHRHEDRHDDGPHWPGKLTARHRLVIDAYQINGGRPLDFAYNFMSTNTPGSALSVLVLRAGAVAIAMNDEIWAKYRMGDTLNMLDPKTGTPTTRNPFLQPGQGTVNNDGAALANMLKAGVVIGACELALNGMARAMAPIAGTSKDDAVREWHVKVVAGITIIPSGVWGLGRAQEAGCGYCSGG